MSIRKMKLKDYGITPGRAAELKEMVKDKQYYSLVRIDWKLCGIYSVRREMFYLSRVQA